MKKTALVLAVSILVGGKALAENQISTPSPTPTLGVEGVKPNINKGNMEVGGTFGLGYSTVSGVFGNINPTLRYFVADHLSLGGSVWAGASQLGSYLSVGPGITYYFNTKSRWVPFIGEDIVYNFSSNYYDGDGSYTNWTSKTRAGVNYFFTPEVAFGPSLIYSHDIGRGANSTGYLTLEGNFSIFF